MKRSQWWEKIHVPLCVFCIYGDTFLTEWSVRSAHPMQLYSFTENSLRMLINYFLYLHHATKENKSLNLVGTEQSWMRPPCSSSTSSAPLLTLQTEGSGRAAPCFSSCQSSSLSSASHHRVRNQLFYREKGRKKNYRTMMYE